VQIQIGPYEFDVSEPYTPGHPLSPVEARVLNSLRSMRVRNILYKRLRKIVPDDETLLTPEQLAEFTQLVSEIDRDFRFIPHDTTKVKRGTLQAEIEEVAREQLPPDASDDEVAARASQQDVIEEATRRFVARQEIAKTSLEELLG